MPAPLPTLPWVAAFGLSLTCLLLIPRVLDAADPDPQPATSGANSPKPADEKTQQAADHRIKGQCYLLERDGDADNRRLTKTPLPNAQVTLFVVRGFIGPPEKVAETTTDGEGHFEFEHLLPPRTEKQFDRLAYGVVARAEGYPPTVMSIFEAERRNGAQIPIQPKSTTLSGRVANGHGEPVAGATIAQYGIHGRPVEGVQSAITNKIGRFRMEDIPVFELIRPGQGVGFRIIHPDYPVTSVSVPSLPSEVVFKLPTGCTLTGSVEDQVTGKPAAGVLVTAQNNKNVSEDAYAVTDEQGHYRLIVADGSYNVIAEAEERVCVAITDQDCREGESAELPLLKLTQGGWIAGRVVNSVTGQTIGTAQQGGPIVVGLFGPGYPPRKKVASPLHLTDVDAQGRFKLRAAAGDNYPYLTNQHGKRMAWDTMKQPPVVVKEGKTVETEILIEPERSAEDKMKAARQVLAGLPKERPQRVAAIINEFRKLNHTVDETEVWCLLMRELVGIGADAVPQLCAELDETNEQCMIRRLGFALRAIGDPRAVPALIRAIPKTLQPSQSDYGLLVADGELTKFMRQHDLDERDFGAYFNFGRPVREVFGALHKLTGQDFEDQALYSIMRSEDPNGRALQQGLYHRQALKWQTWWEAHCQEFTKDEAYSLVRLPPEEPVEGRPVLALGPKAKLGEGSRGATLSPPGEGGDKFVDLDTGLEPKWPTNIPENEDAHGQGDLSLWAAENGVDLMCAIYRSADGTPTYALRGFNMRLWEIPRRDAENMDTFVSAGKLPAAKPAGEFLLHQDEKTGQYTPEENAAFLYITREGGMGLIMVTDRVTRVVDHTGRIGDPPLGEGFHKGVRFNHWQIVP
jgi:hypothetical protein